MKWRTVHTDSHHPEFARLVRDLDAYLAVIDGEDHAFYHQFNKTSYLVHVVLICEGEEAIACGALKPFSEQSMEIKRMYTIPSFRGRGLARQVLLELENWARELGYRSCILETGKRQEAAVKLYPGCGYQIIPNYGQYQQMENSICFEKHL